MVGAQRSRVSQRPGGALDAIVLQTVQLTPTAGNVLDRLRNARDHPLAEAREFRALVDAGMSLEEVALLLEASLGAEKVAELGSFGALGHVKYRLCLLKLAPKFGFSAV